MEKDDKEIKDELLRAAYHALRSFQFGNQSIELAKVVADKIEELIEISPSQVNQGANEELRISDALALIGKEYPRFKLVLDDQEC